ncbi:GDP-mannose 4,6-dehydratase [Alkalihalobacillus sp. MEB203]|uniref:GDP-mannose 4,6-dehydratase n=1 Tax=Alkalihalobacterium chitinilyticum TaxID=2980103 RepID=A0ABT5VB34_9BACI|nr:GDP-mannose 4,6-dehydratase [Alkalihalobacterium chitinilyticum]MDE5412660.1 GDP-mannose 4,6-dehydratase [Alkalihalobacterium chitinilyticum]
MRKEVLVTGGAGFIGANFIQYLLDHTSYHITNIDSLTHSANPEALMQFSKSPYYRFYLLDLRNQDQLNEVFDRQYDVIIHFAALTDVNEKKYSPIEYYDVNVLGTMNLLEKVRQGYAGKFIYVSTGKVYGGLEEKERPSTEETVINPNNSYVESKVSGEMIVRSYINAYQIPAIITRCSNNYGPYQQKQKLIPTVILNALEEKEIPVYGDGEHVRDWIFVKDHCRAIHTVLEHGKLGEVYNISGGRERSTLDVVKLILDYMNKSHQLIRHVEDREEGDRRYALNWEKANFTLSWKPEMSFYNGLVKTIEWYTSKQLQQT